MYAQIPDVVPLLRLTVVDANTVVALKKRRVSIPRRPIEVAETATKSTHRSLLRALVRAAAGRAVDGVGRVVRVADRGGEGSEGQESGDGGEGAHCSE